MARYLAGLLSGREPVKEIRLFGLDQPFLDRHERFWKLFVSELKQVEFRQERATAGLVLVSILGTAAVWVYAVIQASLARITIGDVALVFQAADQARFGLSNLFWIAGMFYENSLFVGNYFGFLDLSPDAVEGALARPASPQPQPLLVPRPIRQGIEFRNVSFRYPGSDRLVLENLSFVIRPCDTVALVGENGSGKTTLVKLLARLYDPTDGVILLDGRDLRDYDLDDVRRQMAVSGRNSP
jgi:ATP-binding cassette subfamily B protein